MNLSFTQYYYGKSQCLMGKLTISMAIFNRLCKGLPEGKPWTTETMVLPWQGHLHRDGLRQPPGGAVHRCGGPAFAGCVPWRGQREPERTGLGIGDGVDTWIILEKWIGCIYVNIYVYMYIIYIYTYCSYMISQFWVNFLTLSRHLTGFLSMINLFFLRKAPLNGHHECSSDRLGSHIFWHHHVVHVGIVFHHVSSVSLLSGWFQQHLCITHDPSCLILAGKMIIAADPSWSPGIGFWMVQVNLSSLKPPASDGCQKRRGWDRIGLHV